MKKGFGIFLIVLAEAVHYSMLGLWLTLTDGGLLGSFLARALGAIAPGAVMHYIDYRLVRSAKSPTP